MKETWNLLNGEVRFAVVGDGILRQQVEEDLRKAGVKCAFVGFERGLSLQRSYASADVFFSPSTTEGFPLVFLEAMASGLSVVGPIAGGIPDCFQEGIEGSLYPPHDPFLCAKAIQKCIEGGEQMKERAYKKGKSFSWESSIAELEQVLKFIVDKKSKSGWRRWWLDTSVPHQNKKKD